jgi:uncharacterized protein with FMN-binding domain
MLTSLPIAAPPPPPPRRWLRPIGVHLLRVAIFGALLVLIHRAHQRRIDAAAAATVEPVPLASAQLDFPTAAAVQLDNQGTTLVTDAAGTRIGTLVQTSPQADRIIGFSGPTNVLIGFDPDDRITAVRIRSTRDTQEHAERVALDTNFLASYVGRTRTEAAAGIPVDAVAGATLTSLAIAESIPVRLGGQARSLRFPESLETADVRPLFPTAKSLTADPERPSLWTVADEAGRRIGCVVRGSPAIDNIVGYQGPTDLIIGLSVPAEGDEAPVQMSAAEIVGVRLGRSFDNEPYVGYVLDDRYFFKTFTAGTLSELARLDLQAAHVEGVSGATMTSLAVAEGLVAAAREQIMAEDRLAAAHESDRLRLSQRDVGTIGVTLAGVLLALSRWRGRRWIRVPFLVGLVAYLGFVNGDLVSQALLVGWTRNGVPWRRMAGPLVLVAAALLLPILTRHNVYCSHLCPHGAVQQLLSLRLRRQWRPGRRLTRGLHFVPGLLMAWVAFVALTGIAADLVDIEPFDAYVPSIAGWPTIALFAIGLVASLFSSMAYCQYGCPTGALLSWLRRHSRRDQLNLGDALLAAACVLAGFTA